LLSLPCYEVKLATLVSFAVLLVKSTIDLQGKKGPSRI
jgi:hypothetical protein